MAAAFSNSAELTIDVWSAIPPRGGRTITPYFEDVRGVRRVEIRGAITRIDEGYIAWLKGRMMMPVGEGGGEGYWE
jgi:hypothetical protein